MKELVIGTTNSAKVDQIRGALATLNLKVLGIKDLGDVTLPQIKEDGQTAVENAHKKAAAYAKVLKRLVFSMDNALYFDDLPADEQPGLHVRRIGKGNDSHDDDAMIDYYSKLINRLSKDTGETKGYWEFGICIASPSGSHRETAIVSPRLFRSIVSRVRVPGYPLESMQVDPDSGKYISEMSEKEQALFWQKAIGAKLMKFVRSTPF